MVEYERRVGKRLCGIVHIREGAKSTDLMGR